MLSFTRLLLHSWVAQVLLRGRRIGRRRTESVRGKLLDLHIISKFAKVFTRSASTHPPPSAAATSSAECGNGNAGTIIIV